MKNTNSYIIIAAIMILASQTSFAQTDSLKRKILTLYPVEIIYPTQISNQNSLSLFPNPASTQIEIKLDVMDNRGFMLELYNDQGLRLVQLKWDSPYLDLSRYPSGMYVLCLRRDQEVYYQKLLIDR